MLTDAAYSGVVVSNGYILQLVEFAEHTHLGKLGYTSYECELYVVVHFLERPEEVLEARSGHFGLFPIAQGMKYEIVVLVNQHHSPLAGMLVADAENILHPDIGVWYIWFYVIFFLIYSQGAVYQGVQLLNCAHVAGTKVEAYYRVLLPFPVGGGYEKLWLLYAIVACKRLKQVSTSLEYGCKGREEQRLPEAAWTAQEIWASLRYHLVQQFCLVYVNIATSTKLLETLYSYRV